ncbi:MAG: hypothetical protein R3E46_18740 [Sedimenticolaceae bacterium]
MKLFDCRQEYRCSDAARHQEQPSRHVAELEHRGHRIRRLADTYGNMQAIAWDRQSGEVTVASDPRGIGAGALIRYRMH